jgi:hypothetical protein
MGPIAIWLVFLAVASAFAEGGIVVATDRTGSQSATIITGMRTVKAVFDAAERSCAEAAHVLVSCKVVKTFNRACAATATHKKGVSYAFGQSVPEAERNVMAYCKQRNNTGCSSMNNSDCDWVKEKTLLCINEIFAERERLRSQVANDATKYNESAVAMTALEAKHCAYAEAPAEDRERYYAGYRFCNISTGMRLGERVYWEVCDAVE